VRVAEGFEGVHRRSMVTCRLRMRHYESTATIDAAPDAVWAILTDGPAYSDWDSGVVRVEGAIAPREKMGKPRSDLRRRHR